MLPILDSQAARSTILRRLDSAEYSYPATVLAGVQRIFGSSVTPPEAVAQILESVRTQGDAALRSWSQRLDSFEGEDLLIPTEKLALAAKALEPDLRASLELAIERVRAFHQRQPLISWTTQELGGHLGLRVTPIRRVGIYVPGGSAPLPSSLIMAAIPAQVAGVEEIVVCTPPIPHEAILAAAHLCGVKRLYQVGGAQAVAALAFGTESIPRVDKIAGPGNLFVTLAKQQVYGAVGLDGLAGPTETMIIADHSADPALVAADLLAQAEHDPLAAALLLTPDQALAQAVQVESARQVEGLSRHEIIAQSLAHQSGIVVTASLEEAAELANEYAPEHLALVVEEPEAWAEKISNAGALFLGPYSFEVLGDYVAGPNHVLPTGGSARFNSCLSALDFVKLTAVIHLDQETSRALSKPAAGLARAETLTAHAAAADARQESGA